MTTANQQLLDYLAAYRNHAAACGKVGQIADLLAKTAEILRTRRDKPNEPVQDLPADGWPTADQLRQAIDDCQRFAEESRVLYRSLPQALTPGLAQPPR